MPPDNNALLGRLGAQIETLSTMMTTTVAQFGAQSQAQARIETQLEAVEARIVELRKSLYGEDGAGGVIHKLNTIENTVTSSEKDTAALKKVLDDSKKTLVKIILLVLGSGAISGGLASRLLEAFAE